MARERKNVLVVLGPTASGKTRLGVRLARALAGEVVSADSRHVYRGLSIGAGKDLEEYDVDGVAVPYHLIDIVDLDEEFSVFDYQKRFFEVFEAVTARGVLPVVVGGTGLYIEAVLKGYKMVEVPEDRDLRAELASLSHGGLVARLRGLKDRLHNVTDLQDRSRLVRAIEIATFSKGREPEPTPALRPLILGTRWERDELRRRIRERLKRRFENGMIEEVEALVARGVTWEKLDFLGLEYRYVGEFLQGRMRNRNDLFQKVYSAICRFAKRQETWFRRMERSGTVIHCVNRADLATASRIAYPAFPMAAMWGPQSNHVPRQDRQIP